MQIKIITIVLLFGTSIFGCAADQEPDTALVVNEAKTEEKKAAPLHHHPTLVGMLQRNNALRAGQGLWAHRMNPALTQAAQNHANYMARTGDFQHYSNNGPSGRAQLYGWRAGVRENIAMGTGTISGTFVMWQNSGAHWASIVSGTTEAGFGYALSVNGHPYWVGVYGNRSTADAEGETEEEAVAAVKAAEAEALAKAEPTADAGTE